MAELRRVPPHLIIALFCLASLLPAGCSGSPGAQSAPSQPDAIPAPAAATLTPTGTARPASAGGPPGAMPTVAAKASPAAPAPAAPPPQAGDLALKFLTMVDEGQYAEAFAFGLQVKWNVLGLQSYQSAGLMTKEDWIDFFDQWVGIAGGNLKLHAVAVARIERVAPDAVSPSDFPELFTLAAIPGKPQPLGLYLLEVGGTFDTPETCEPHEFRRRLVVAELPAPLGWQALLAGRPTPSVMGEPGEWLTNDRPFADTQLIG